AELAVDGGKAHVSHFVEPLEAFHHGLADGFGRDLVLARVEQGALDVVDQRIHLFEADGPLLAGLENATLDLPAIEGLPSPILLDDHLGDFFDALVRGKPAATLEALAAAANGIAFLG